MYGMGSEKIEVSRFGLRVSRAIRAEMGARMEQRTRRETATLLIPQLEYATLENIYDGEAYPMAVELNVTEQVLRDYKELILGRRQYV